MEVGSTNTTFTERFGGIDIKVEVPSEVNDELTGLVLDHSQVVEGMKTEVRQLESLKVGKNMTESEARKLAKEKGVKILTSRWVNTQKTPTLARCRLVVRDFASGAESAFRSGIYAPTSSLDSLRCVLTLASLWDLWLITSDVSTAFMYAEVEEDACDLVLLPSNISFKGERVVCHCLLFKAMNGLRRAPLLWFYQLQRTIYTLGGEDTFESTLFRIPTKRGVILLLVYVDDLLIASQDQQEGENLLKKLMEIWKMKITGRINCQKKGALQFLGRSIYRAQDGESSLYFGVSREYMVGIFESWGENIKTGHVGLMPKLEDVHKEFVKKFGEEPLTEKGIQRYRRVLGQLAWAALSRADLSFPISFLSRFQAKPNPAAEQCMRVFMKWLSGNLHFVQRMPAPQCPHTGESKEIVSMVMHPFTGQQMYLTGEQRDQFFRDLAAMKPTDFKVGTTPTNPTIPSTGFPPVPSVPPAGYGYGAMPSMGTPGAAMNPGTPLTPSHPPASIPPFTAPPSLPVLPKSSPP